MADWSDLTKDVVQLIASKLELPDYYRFGAVCQNWQSAAKAKRYPPAKQLPWLLLGEDEKTQKRVFFSLSEGKHYYMDISELHGHVCRGSSYGWLCTVDRELDAHLINPLTRECIKLPPLPDYSKDFTLEDCKALQGKERYQMQCEHVCKAILSNNPSDNRDFTLVIIVGSPSVVAFWRPSDANWSVVDVPYVGIYEVMYFKGKLYALTCFALSVVDLGPHPKMTRISSFPFDQREFVPEEVYLVDLAGESLLLIHRIEADNGDDDGDGDGDGDSDGDGDGDGDDDCAINRDSDEDEVVDIRYWRDEEAHRHFVTKELDVFELDLERGKCCKRGDIDGCALFVGSGLLVVIDPSQVPGCVPDRISYTGTVSMLPGFSRTGFYDMASETIGEYNPYQHFIHYPVSPTWFTPNPW